MNSNIPKHWVETSLKEVVHNKKGKKPKKLEPVEFEKSSPYIDIEAFETGKIKQFGDIASSNICDKKDVLVVWDGARFGLTGSNQSGAIGSTLACLTPILIESTYLLRFIQRHYQTIQSNPKGTGIPHVNPEVFWSLEFPLAPLNEQKRIVEKLDTILPKVKNAKARLENIPKILKKFRQSVLADACSGKLTEEWREGKELPEWEEKKLGEFIINIEAGKSLKCIEIPPKENEIGIVKVSAVSWGSFMENESKTLPKNVKYNDKWLISKGDFLFSRANTTELVGACVVVEKIKLNLLLSDKTLRFLLNNSLNSHWLMYFLRCSRGRDQIESLATGNQPAMKNISQGKIKEIIIPLPPIEEQHEIIRRVEKLFAIANLIEEKYKIAIARVEKIEQSVLAKAFRGELVEPDPSDEPAEILLKRILDVRAVRAKDFSPLRKPNPKKRAS